LSNFNPKKYILEVLEKDFNKKNAKYYPAYRYSPGKNNNFDYKTWDQLNK
jgi:hypothetical protein